MRRRPGRTELRRYSTSTGSTRNVLNKLDDLRNRSQQHPNEKIDRDIYKNFILNKDMYLAAYEKLKSKPGNMTPGINPTTLDGISMYRIDKLIDKLRDESFKFTMGRRVKILKKGTRPLTVGSPMDKLVQEVMRMVLEAIYEPLFSDESHGFRPNRSTHTALRQV